MLCHPRRVLIPLVAAAALTCSVLAGQSSADASPPHGANANVAAPGIEQELQTLVDTPGGPPGAIVDMVRDGHHTVFRAGVADIATGERPEADDFMRVASVAKAFSGAVALQLVDSGHLGLDDTLAERLPSLPAAWGAVTLRQLLQHTSGLPDFTGSDDFRAVFIADPRHQFDSRQLLSFVADVPLQFAPGTQYRYSNSDNIAVALMAEAATGIAYEDLLRCLVSDPLEMHRTSLPQGYLLPRRYLHGYDVPPTGAPEDVSTLASASGAWASGGVVATPSDLDTFIRAYAGGALLSQPVRQQQLAFIPGFSEPAGPGQNSVGLALFRYDTRCGTVYGHTGNTFGYTQLAVASPDGKRSMAFTVTSQIKQSDNPALLAKLRAVQEDFVCELLGH